MATASFPIGTPPDVVRKASDILDCVKDRQRLERRRLTTPEWFVCGLRVCGEDVPDGPQSVIRSGLSNASVEAAFTGQINQFFADSFGQVKNSLDGILTSRNVANFLPAIAISQYQSGRLQPQGKEPASQFYFGLKGENWGIARFTTQWAIGEMDLYNSPSVDLAGFATKEVARAAARLLPDLCYSLLLSNPLMTGDGLPLFHATHGNYGVGVGSALQAAGVDTPDALDTGLAAVGKQVLTDGDGLPIHVNLAPQFLICAPAAYGPARRLVRRLLIEDGQDIAVRMESRLSSVGVCDPKSGNVYAGTDGAWLLASPAEQAASIIVGGLEGQGVEPVLRVTPMGGGGTGGRWGLECDCKLDIGAVAVDHRGLYFAAGQ
jgi:hypothetical protein